MLVCLGHKQLRQAVGELTVSHQVFSLADESLLTPWPSSLTSSPLIHAAYLQFNFLEVITMNILSCKVHCALMPKG